MALSPPTQHSSIGWWLFTTNDQVYSHFSTQSHTVGAHMFIFFPKRHISHYNRFLHHQNDLVSPFLRKKQKARKTAIHRSERRHTRHINWTQRSGTAGSRYKFFNTNNLWVDLKALKVSDRWDPPFWWP